MSERQKQTEFLKTLLGYEDTEERRALEARLHKAERDERCLRRACGLVSLMAFFSLAGLGYSAVLVPEFFHNATPWLVKFFYALVLGSAFCLTVFTSLWLWYRSVSNRHCGECRRFFLAVLEAKAKFTPVLFGAEGVSNQDRMADRNGTTGAAAKAGIASLSQAS